MGWARGCRPGCGREAEGGVDRKALAAAARSGPGVAVVAVQRAVGHENRAALGAPGCALNALRECYSSNAAKGEILQKCVASTLFFL